jgi:hypothetical protein
LNGLELIHQTHDPSYETIITSKKQTEINRKI